MLLGFDLAKQVNMVDEALGAAPTLTVQGCSSSVGHKRAKGARGV